MGFSGEGAVMGAAAGAPIPFVGPAGGALLGGFFGGSDKVKGVPTPGGGDLGKEYHAYQDAAFPGTTPWERLGASTPMGAQVSSDQGSRTQLTMQKADLANKSSIADKSNRASIISSGLAQGPQAVDSGLSRYSTGAGSDYDSPNRRDRERWDTDRPGSIGRSTLDSERGRRSSDSVDAEIFSNRYRSTPSTIMGLLGESSRSKPFPKLGRRDTH